MRRFYSLLAAMMLVIIVLAACNSKDSGTGANSGSFGAGKSGANQSTPGGAAASSTPTTMSDGVRRVTIVELRDMLDKGSAIVIDTRGADSYKASHIKGSISIPVDEIANHINDLPRDKTIVAYCSWPNEHTSARAVQIMKDKGIENAAALLGGTNAWQNAGYPMESGEK